MSGEPEVEPEVDTAVDTEVDPYLWDGSGTPERDVAQLEKLLGRFAHDAQPARAPARPRLPRGWMGLGLLAAAALLLVWWRPFGGAAMEAPPDGYRVAWAKGTTVARVGERVEALDAPAVMTIGDIGEVEVLEGSIVRVEDVGQEHHALYLERGTIRARIDAAPRVFQVGSPAGLTIDLGCEYELSLGAGDRIELSVRTGEVSLEHGGREVYVPAGASTTSNPITGPEPPLFDDADPDLRGAIDSVLHSKGYGKDDLDRLVSLTDRDEALPLFAMLFDPTLDVSLREAIYERFEAVFQLPDSVTRERVLACDPQAREEWLAETLQSWWRRQR